MRKLAYLASALILLSLFSLAFLPMDNPNGSSHAVSPDSLQFVGHVLHNGDVAVLYYNSPTGTQIIHSGTVVPVNQICIEIYSIEAGNISINGSQFKGFQLVNVTQHFGNQTLKVQEKVQVNPQYFNNSIQVQTRAFQESTLQIPGSSNQENVQLQIDNTTISFLHATSPDLIPSQISGLGQLGIYLTFLLLGIFIFFLGSGTAAAIIKRMRYWPSFGKTGWFFIIFFLLCTIGALYLFEYYQLAYISWYDWLIPLYFLSVLGMMDLWPQSWERYFILVVGGADPKDQSWDALFPRITKNPEDGTIEYLRPGRLEAISRIWKHIPLQFEGGKAQPIELSPNEEKIQNLYIANSPPELRYSKSERKGKRVHMTIRSRPESYHIDLSSHSQKEVGAFISELKTVAEFSNENDSLRKENRDYKIMLESGKIRYGAEEINQITRKLYNANLEFHKGKAPEETKKPKKEEEHEPEEE